MDTSKGDGRTDTATDAGVRARAAEESHYGRRARGAARGGGSAKLARGAHAARRGRTSIMKGPFLMRPGKQQIVGEARGAAPAKAGE